MEITTRQDYKEQEQEGGDSDKQVYGVVPVIGRTAHRLSIGCQEVVRKVTPPRT